MQHAQKGQHMPGLLALGSSQHHDTPSWSRNQIMTRRCVLAALLAASARHTLSDGRSVVARRREPVLLPPLASAPLAPAPPPSRVAPGPQSWLSGHAHGASGSAGMALPSGAPVVKRRGAAVSSAFIQPSSFARAVRTRRTEVLLLARSASAERPALHGGKAGEGEGGQIPSASAKMHQSVLALAHSHVQLQAYGYLYKCINVCQVKETSSNDE